MRRSLGVAVLLAVMVVVGCDRPATVPTPAPDVDLGGVWTVARVGDVPAVSGVEPRVEFLEDGRVIRVVAKECSDVRADVAIRGSSFRVGALQPADLQPCGGDVREFAGLAHDALARATSITGSPGRLMISGPATELLLVRRDLELMPDEQAFVRSLQANEWRYVDGDPPTDSELPPIRIGPGTLQAVGPCGFEGAWTYRGEDLVHTDALTVVEDGDCPATEGQARAALLDVLGAVERASFGEDGMLRLTGRGGDLTFEAAER